MSEHNKPNAQRMSAGVNLHNLIERMTDGVAEINEILAIKEHEVAVLHRTQLVMLKKDLVALRQRAIYIEAQHLRANRPIEGGAA